MADCPGIYVLAQMKDGLLARIRVPGGRLSSVQLKHMASASEEFGSGIIDLTNRANLQIRGIVKEKQPALIEYLVAHDLISKDPTHDRLRNIAIDPLSGLVDEVTDCHALSIELDRAISQLSCKDQISPKFSIILDGGGITTISGLGHDFALVAKKSAMFIHNTIVFQLYLAGQKTPLEVSGKNLVSTVINWIEQLVAASKPEPLLVKKMLAKHGLSGVVSILDDTITEMPMPITKKIHRLLGSQPQQDQQNYAVSLMSPSSRLLYFQAIGLAELAERYSGGELRLTPWQAVILPNVADDDIALLWEKAEGLGLITQETEQNLSIVSCAGSDGCVHGGFETKAKALEIRDTLADLAFPKPVTIHLSACEKGCASRADTNYLVLQRRHEKNPHLYVNTSPGTTADGKKVNENDIISELKKLI